MADMPESGELGKASNKTRNVWKPCEEKEFLVLCSELKIAEELDLCLTSAGNEEVYMGISNGLFEAGYPRRETQHIRAKYRKLKAKFLDIKQHNLHATGRNRKDWVHYDLAESVWGHRAVASKEVIDTDNDELLLNHVDDGKDVHKETEEADVPVSKKMKGPATPSKRRSSSKNKEDRSSADMYFVDRMVELEEKRMEQEQKLEKQRLDAEKEARESQMNFQKEMFKMMFKMQQHQPTYSAAGHPPHYDQANCSNYELYQF